MHQSIYSKSSKELLTNYQTLSMQQQNLTELRKTKQDLDVTLNRQGLETINKI